MPHYFTKSIEITLLGWAVFQTGFLMVMIQLVAWVLMTQDLSQEVSVAQAIKILSKGDQSCTICKFVSENTPTDNSHDSFYLRYDVPLLYLVSLASEYFSTLVAQPLPDDLHCDNKSSAGIGVEPPPPKVFL